MTKVCKRCNKSKDISLFYKHFLCKMCAKVNRDHTKALLLNEEYDRKWFNIQQTHSAWKSGVATSRDSAWNTVFKKREQTS